ncbi:MAG: hypothetical protein DRP78_04635, partial [Candidatus Omnitrophota bacterium]
DHLSFAEDITSPQKAGAQFILPQILAKDIYGNTLTNDYSAAPYSGTKTISYTLSGASDAPDGNGLDSWTTTVDFTNGGSTTTLATNLYRSQNTTITPVAADLSGTNTASNSITVGPEIKTKLVFSQEPSSTGIINAALTQQPIVEIQDTYGNITADTDAITLYDSLSNTSFVDGTGSLSSDANPLSATAGSAEFGNLTCDSLGTIYLYAEDVGIASAFSQAITFSAAATSTVDTADSPVTDFNLYPINDTLENRFAVLKFKVTDNGGDSTATLLDQIVVNIGGTGANAGTDIAWAGIYQDTTLITTGTITNSTITFGSSPDGQSDAELYSVTDTTAVEFAVYIYMNTEKLEAAEADTYTFSINESLIGTDTNMSSQMSSNTSSVSTVTGTITIAVSHIEVVTSPAGESSVSLTAGTAENIKLRAVDANKNVDSDYTGNHTFKFSGLSVIGSHHAQINDAINFGNNVTIPFTSGESDVVSLTAYRAETGAVSAQDQVIAYEAFTLSASVSASAANTLSEVSGNSQSGATEAVLPQGFVAQIDDSYGNIVSGHTVDFVLSTCPSGAAGQSLSANSADTNASGQAETILTLGDTAGDYIVQASSSDLSGSPLSFTATALLMGSLNKASGDNQNTFKVNEILSLAFVAQLLDTEGTPIPNETINFSILSSPETAAGQSLSADSDITDASGNAQTILTLGDKIGDYVVRAAISNLTVDFTATAQPETPDKVLLSGPSSVSSEEVSTAFTVSIQDADDNLSQVTQNTVFSLTTTSATGVFSSDSAGETAITQVTVSSDTSSASFYYQDTTVGSPTITAQRLSGQSLNTDSDTTSISIIPGNINYFIVTGETSTISAGASRQITITAYDPQGNITTGYSGDMNIIFSGANLSPSAQSPTCSNSSSTDIDFGTQTLVTFSSGVGTAALKVYKAESVSIKATSGSVATSDANDLNFIVRHTLSDHLKFAGNIPAAQTAGTIFNFETALNAVDLYDNLCDGANGASAYIGEKTITWQLSGTANGPESGTDTFTNPVTFTAGASAAALQATLYRAQDTTITAAAADLSGTNTASNTITVNAQDIAKLSFSVQPSTTVITNVSLAEQPQVSVADVYGNACVSASAQITLSASTTSGTDTPVTNGTLTADSLSVTTENGMAVFSAVNYNYPEQIYLKATVSGYSLDDIYSYQITVSTAGEAVVSAGSLLEPDEISSLIDTYSERADVFDFTFTDTGTDGYDLQIKQIIVQAGANDTTGGWESFISGAVLSDGTSSLLGVVEGTRIVFGSGESIIYTVSDGQAKTYTLSIYLESSLPAGADGKALEFSVDVNDDLSLDLLSSSFPESSAITSGAKPVVAVTATKFVISGEASVSAGDESVLSIQALDANNNLDLDFAGDKNIVFSGAQVSLSGTAPSCTNYLGVDINFGSTTVISFIAGESSSTITLKLYTAEIARIKATASSITTSDTDDLDIVVSGTVAAQLFWQDAPQETVAANAPLAAFSVSVSDCYGNTTSETSDVTISVSGGTPGAVSVNTVTAVSGLATFTGFNVCCASYPGIVTLQAASLGLTSSAVSSNIIVEEQYTITLNIQDATNASALTEITLDILQDGSSLTAYPVECNSPYSFQLPFGTYSFNLRKALYVESTTEKVVGVTADAVDGSYDNAITWTMYMTSLAEATADYHVKESFVYDEDNDKLTARLWLERRGSLVLNDDTNKLGTASIQIYDDTNQEWLAISTFDAPNPVDYTTGMYFKEIENIIAEGGTYTLTAGKTYFVRCKINYGGSEGSATTYEAGASLTITQGQSLTNVTQSIEEMSTAIRSDVAGIRVLVQSQAEETRTAIEEVKDDILEVTGTTSLPDRIDSMRETILSDIASSQESVISSVQTTIGDEVKPHIRSKILNREKRVKQGATVVISYRTESGLSPAIDLYNSNNVLRVSKGAMTEIGSTGVYKYPVTFLSSWGTGEFTVVCSETTLGTADAYTITVVTADIEDVASQVSAVLGTTSGISDLEASSTALNTGISGLDTEISGLDTKLSDIKTKLDTISSGASTGTGVSINPVLQAEVSQMGTSLTELGNKIESSSASASSGVNIVQGADGVVLQGIYAEIEAIGAKLKEANYGGLPDLAEYLSVDQARQDDLMYLKNKTEEMKAIVEMTNKMIESIDSGEEKPITHEWYEFR